jgi:hypothetical protein
MRWDDCASGLPFAILTHANSQEVKMGAHRIWGRNRCFEANAFPASVVGELEIPVDPMLAWIDTIERSDGLSLNEINRILLETASHGPGSNPQLSLSLGRIHRLPASFRRWVLRLPELFPGMWAWHRGGALPSSSPAKYGVKAVIGTWTSPLGVSSGLVRQRTVLCDGRAAARPTFLLTLTFDRRVMAGPQAVRFFHGIVRRLDAAAFDEAAAAGIPAPAFCAVGERR